MKKIFLSIIGILMTLCLAACGTSANNAAINSLGSQLDETSNAITSVQEVSPLDVNFDSSAIATNSALTQQSLYGENNYKQEILARTAKIKNDIGKKTKLSKAQVSAVKELTNNLSKYTNSINYTKNELSSTVKSLKKYKKNAEKYPEKVNAKLTKLACNSNTRASYYENILNTLDQIEDIVNCDDCYKPQTLEETQNNEINQDENLDNNENEETDENENNTPQIRQPRAFERMTFPTPVQNGAYPMPYYYRIGYRFQNGYPNGNFSNGINRNYMGFNSVYPYGNENFMNGYFGENGNMPYNYNFRFYRFNPYRNTDTYYPNLSNIDTYRLPTNENVTQVDNAEERLEDFEEIKDGELEKIDSKDNQINNFDNLDDKMFVGEDDFENKDSINQDDSEKTDENVDPNFSVEQTPENLDQNFSVEQDDLDKDFSNTPSDEKVDEDFSLNILILNSSDKTFEDWKREIKCKDGNCEETISVMAKKPSKKIVAH